MSTARTARLASKILSAWPIVCRCLLILSILALAATSSAQQLVYFPQPALVGHVQHDLDGDGLLDLVTAGGPIAGFQHAPITVRAGHGNGTFAEGTQLSSLPEHTALVGDVTGDGLLDIVGGGHATASLVTWALHVHVADGAGFGAPVQTALENSVLHLEQALGDLDDDGRLDWIGLSADEPIQFLVGLSDGAGHFTLAAPASISPLAAGMAVADFNGDGDLDVAIGNSSFNEIVTHLGTGDGGFSGAPVSSPLTDHLTNDPALCAADLDEDGDVDLVAVTGNLLVNAMSVLLADGDAHFTLQEIHDLDGLGRPLVGDVNGDEVRDIVVTVGDGSLFFIPLQGGAVTFLGNGSGFSAPIVTPCNVVPFSASNVISELADVDADGQLDVEMASSLLFGQGDGTFAAATIVDLPDGPQRDITAADMNLDGEQDLVSVVKTKEPAGLFVSLGDGAGHFEPHTWGVTGSMRVVPGDIDGDGAPDLGRATSNAPLITEIVFNDGTGLGVTGAVGLFDFGAADLELTDLDGDGALDVLGTKPDDVSLYFRLSDGAGGFLPTESVPLGSKASRLAAADFDDDGALDVAVGLKPPLVAFLRGTGGGALATPQLVPVPETAHVMLFADLDADGLLDLTVGSGAAPAPELHVLLAQSPFSFGAATPLPLAEGPTVLLAADIDGDSRPDLVTTDDQQGALTVFRNDGGGQMTLGGVTAANGKAGVIADFNGDGRPDVALADDSVIVLPNVLGDFPNLGFQHGGNLGTPHLVTSGTPVPNQLVSFTATAVPLPALGFLVLGFDFTPQPFAGGTLVPSPDVMLPMLPDVTLAGRWPQLPAGVKVYAQAWFSTGDGIAATKAVLGVTQ